jgi:hypothetical protein
MHNEIIEEIIDHFGRTGNNRRPRIRKFHAELLFSKYRARDKLLKFSELERDLSYIKRFVKFSKGFVDFIDEESGEMILTNLFFDYIEKLVRQYKPIEDFDANDQSLAEQGIYIDETDIHFDNKLTYSRFYKLVSDEGEALNDPSLWKYSEDNISKIDYIDFSDKTNALFSSKLILLKFYVLRKIDEVAFVTSRYVHCPACGANYSVSATKIDFMQTYKCENLVGESACGTTLKKFPARKMIPTYIYEIAAEVKTENGFEYKEYFVESFQDLAPGFYTGMVFGRTENKNNNFYFTCIKAKKERSKHEFIFNSTKKHKFHDFVDSTMEYITSVGFVIDKEKAKLVFYIEALKKLITIVNKEINLDHSLYFGAPGIGKSSALILLHHCFYSNTGLVSGPRFTLPGLTGGQKEVYYQDTSKKKNVPGLFSNQAFIFDEINNAHFLSDNKAVNLFKSVALSSTGNSATVGGKEFLRTALVAGSANYDIDFLKKYENTVNKIYLNESRKKNNVQEQISFLEVPNSEIELPVDFDFYADIRKYGLDIPKELRLAVIKARDTTDSYLTGFPKPLMERFYWTVLVHPKYDRMLSKQKEIDVLGHLKTRDSLYSQRELIAQLYITELDTILNSLIHEVKTEFSKKEIETKWSQEAKNFLSKMTNKYSEFFAMFNRIPQVHVYALWALSLVNGETHLSYETKRIFERLISLCHVPISLEDFNNPDFEKFFYIGEQKYEILKFIRENPNKDIREHVDIEKRKLPLNVIEILLKEGRIIQTSKYTYAPTGEESTANLSPENIISTAVDSFSLNEVNKNGTN